MAFKTLFADSFDRPNGPVGAPWQSFLGQMVILDNKAIPQLCSCISGVPIVGKNVWVETTVTQLAISNALCVLFINAVIDSSGNIGESGYSITIRSNGSAEVRIDWADSAKSEVVLLTENGFVSYGDVIRGFVHQYDGKNTFSLYKNGFLYKEVDLPRWTLSMPLGEFSGIWIGAAICDDFKCGIFEEQKKRLVPLQKSWAATQLEDDLRNIIIDVFNNELREQAEEISFYGSPQIGPLTLIERGITADGLAVLRQNQDEDYLRHLYKGFKFNNPQRGMHFLNFYLRLIFGNVFDVNQLWNNKEADYTADLKTLQEIQYAEDDVMNYYLTSRIRVDVDTEIIPDRIIQSLRTAVAARFVLQMRIAKYTKQEWKMALSSGATVIFNAKGQTVNPPIFTDTTFYTAMISGASNVMNARGTSLEPTAEPPLWNLITEFDNSFYSIAVSKSGKIYVGGTFAVVGGFYANCIAVLSDGEWQTVGGSVTSPSWFDAIVSDIAFDSDGNVYAVGTFTHLGGVEVNGIGKFDGDEWFDLGAGVTGFGEFINCVACDSVGNVYIGGYINTVDGVTVSGVAKYDVNTETWGPLGTLGVTAPSEVKCIVIDEYDRVFIGGTFTDVDGATAYGVAMWDGSAWNTLGGGLSYLTSTVGAVNCMAIDKENGLVICGGIFTEPNGGVANSFSNLAGWNGSSWTRIGSIGVSEFDEQVKSIAINSAGSIFVSGLFTAIGSLSISYLSKYSATGGWQSLDGESFAVNGKELAIGKNGEVLYLGGLSYHAFDDY